MNRSNIAVDLLLDLRGEEEKEDAPDGVEFLEIEPVDEDCDDDEALKSVHEDNNDNQ